MHVLVIGKPRSRTSFLTSALINKFNISHNHHENFNYNFNYNDYLEKLALTKSNPNIEDVYKKQLRHLENITEQVFAENNGIIKIFPRHIISHLGEKRKIYSYKDFTFKVMLNVSEIFQLNKYNKILLLNRDLQDSAISYIVGKITGQALFTESDKLISDQIANTAITITKDHIPQLNYYIFEYIVYEDLYNFIKNNYDCTLLHYDTVVKYVSEDLKISDNFYVNPKFNYSKIVTNYSDIVQYCNSKREEYLSLYSNNKFS